jgi:hypothetical protein
MSGMLQRLRGVWLIAAVLFAAAGGGFLSNMLFHAPGSSSEANSLEAGFYKAAALGATSTHGNDSAIMCTGEVDVGIEAVYVLDVVTGELRGGVLNTRTGRFMTSYTYSNVAKDLQSDSVKNPKYLMVTGEAQATQGFGGNGRIGRSVLYIAEVNSGYVACYAARWDQGRAAATTPATYPLLPMDRFPFRQDQVIRPK